MRRRRFLGVLGGAGVAWPLAARAQQPERMRRLGVLFTLAKDNAEGQARLAAFRQGLEALGWTNGRNLQIDDRWPGDDSGRLRAYAAELVNLKPDAIMVGGSRALIALAQTTHVIPIVFVAAAGTIAGRHRDRRLALPARLVRLRVTTLPTLGAESREPYHVPGCDGTTSR